MYTTYFDLNVSMLLIILIICNYSKYLVTKLILCFLIYVFQANKMVTRKYLTL
jgi:hypothetical protein